ncbi:MAG: L,D-transpeptidase [Sulfuritalea sp.]|nr:L,D-transpeptidase [Sulfuritalea sp.]
MSLPQQTLELHDERGSLLQRYVVSTARNGAGERNGSFCTPRGRHIVRAKIGAGATANTVFVRRRPTGELWTPQLAEQFPGRDWILTRILWLSGKEPGRNRLGEVDTMRRYIYLHGSPDAVAMGTPGSIGCVRMRNSDIIELFDRVPRSIRPWISSNSPSRPVPGRNSGIRLGRCAIPSSSASSMYCRASSGMSTTPRVGM